MRRVAVAVLLAFPAVLTGQEPVDFAMVAKIRAEGLERSRVLPIFDTLVTVIGPRLTGSAAYMRAAKWSQSKLAQWGVRDARLESWPFGRGWELDQFSIEMVEPRYMPLHGFAEAWTPSTPREITASVVSIAGKPFDQVQKLAPQIKGGILMQAGVMTNFITADRIQPTAPDAPPAQPPAQRGAGGGRGGAGGGRGNAAGGGRGGRGGDSTAPLTDAQKITQLITNDAVPAVIIKPTRGLHGSLFLQGGSYRGSPRSTGIVLAAEHYNMIARLIENGVPVKLRVNVKTRYLTGDTNSVNIIGEIPGTDPALKDQIVMLGAHLDSWHSALGAADNGDGAAIMLEAMRILQAVGVKPRRTIRVALWGGEEEGLLGSRAWVQKNLADSAAREKFSVYFNIDPGSGPIYGWYAEGNETARRIFDAWMEPFKDIGYRKNLISGIGNTDHLSYTGVGVPGFNPIQDYTDYDTRIHHTNWDTPERVPPESLKHAAVIFASFAYHAAMRDGLFPRR